MINDLEESFQDGDSIISEILRSENKLYKLIKAVCQYSLVKKWNNLIPHTPNYWTHLFDSRSL